MDQEREIYVQLDLLDKANEELASSIAALADRLTPTVLIPADTETASGAPSNCQTDVGRRIEMVVASLGRGNQFVNGILKRLQV